MALSFSVSEREGARQLTPTDLAKAIYQTFKLAFSFIEI